MTRYLLDTDTFTHHLRGHPAVAAAVAARLPAELAVSIITVEELWDGWQAVVRKARTPQAVAAAYGRLTDTVTELRHWAVVPFPEPAVLRYAELRRQKLNVGANDLRIAATALEAGATVVTANVRDFARVPGTPRRGLDGRRGLSDRPVRSPWATSAGRSRELFAPPRARGPGAGRFRLVMRPHVRRS